VIGRTTSGGTASDNGLIIGLDINGAESFERDLCLTPDGSVQIFTSFRRLGSDRSLLMIPVHDAPAAEESILYYLPDEQILITNAGFEPAYNDGREPASDATMFMIEKVAELDLEVRTLICFGGGIATWDEVLASSLKRSEWEQSRSPMQR
jgi:hypothetical protein